MGTCKTNCCNNERTSTYTVGDPDETSAPMTKSHQLLVDANTVSDRWELVEEIIENSKYDSLTYQAAGSLFNPDIYEILMKGGSLEPLIAERIRHLKTKALLNLLDYIYETISNFSKSAEDDFSNGLSTYFKLSFKKFFVEFEILRQGINESNEESKKLLEASMTNFIEIYHFFKYYQNALKKFKIASYRDNYWKGITDINSHIKRIIFSTVDVMSKLNKTLLDKPLNDLKTELDVQNSIGRKMLSTSNFINSVFMKV